MVDTEIIPEYVGIIGAVSSILAVTVVKDKSLSPILFWGGIAMSGVGIFKLVNENTDFLSGIDLDVGDIGLDLGGENGIETPKVDLPEGEFPEPALKESGRAHKIAPKNMFRSRLDLNKVGL